MPADRQPSRDITFESVDFGYPGTGRNVLQQLNLRIPAGKSVAIVGVNDFKETAPSPLTGGIESILTIDCAVVLGPMSA